MPRTCTTCSHPHRGDIDRLLLEGTPFRNIAKWFSLSAAGLFRRNKHLSTTLASSQKEAEILGADGLLEHLNHLAAKPRALRRKPRKRRITGLPWQACGRWCGLLNCRSGSLSKVKSGHPPTWISAVELFNS